VLPISPEDSKIVVQVIGADDTPIWATDYEQVDTWEIVGVVEQPKLEVVVNE
jgi:hypothetical protein